jgi:hypothetical protein
MKNIDHTIVWLFRFALEKEDGTYVEREIADSLFEKIIEWAEANGCQVGGGYRAPTEEELADGPIFDER